ncbi:response regulator [uncultured Parasutterella sp.]|uniref:response regulator transcription factor n=1 Tax=uncultured Parasutterella sp. TaxID=1263098 RepID=UPI0025FFA475|nr:response regulator [uncultured Parasutterella sp.]
MNSEILNKSDFVIRVLDDDEELLDSIDYFLTTEGWTVETFNDVEALFQSWDDEKSGCLLLDIQMPKANGLEVQRRLDAAGYVCPIIFMSSYGTLDTAIEAFRNGAFDFFKKPFRSEELLAAVTRSVKKDIQRRQAAYKESPLGIFNSLTERERQVAHDLKQGMDSALISEHLNISQRTLERYRQNIFKRYNVRNGDDFREKVKDIHF